MPETFDVAIVGYGPAGAVMRALCGLGLKRELEAVTRPGVEGMRFVIAATARDATELSRSAALLP